MNYLQTTQVPNQVFDNYMSELSGSELKVLLTIIRQTYGWIDKSTGDRKQRDWISHGLFMKKTGLSRRAVVTAVQLLLDKRLIVITNRAWKELHGAKERRGYFTRYPIGQSLVLLLRPSLHTINIDLKIELTCTIGFKY